MNKIIVVLLAFGLSCQHVFTQVDTSGFNLMPWPQNIQHSNPDFTITDDFTISILGDDAQGRVEKAAVRFLRHLSNKTSVFLKQGFPVKIEGKTSAVVELTFDGLSDLSINADESYSLNVTSDKITIHSQTDVGALRALATLLQLVAHNPSNYFIPGVVVNDAPRFVWRGLMIDSARHFQPVDVLKRNLDAMACVKMNVFHLHLTYDQGSRAEI